MLKRIIWIFVSLRWLLLKSRHVDRFSFDTTNKTKFIYCQIFNKLLLFLLSQAELTSLKQEELSVRNLANVAKPAELPKLKPSQPETLNESKKSVKMPIIGKRKMIKKRRNF